jgi:alkanesulfonate monooxygenase SsuD/methylene tetrahydromethanopterin reductase-like flavin-dependent oxidoreductase (luciferase family)
MRIGVTLPLAEDDTEDGRSPTFAETLGYAQHAEELGLDSIWVFDHLLFRSEGEPDEGIREAWTTLAALATVVPRVELGALVMCASFRNPGLMAKMAATLDDLSGGRLILGLGSGWHEPEYDAFGFPFDHRVGRFAEDLEITARLLRKERVSFDGRWRQLDDAVLIPAPERAVPVLVAAKGPRMLRLTGHLGGGLERGVVLGRRRPTSGPAGRPRRSLHRRRARSQPRCVGRSASGSTTRRSRTAVDSRRSSMGSQPSASMTRSSGRRQSPSRRSIGSPRGSAGTSASAKAGSATMPA